MKQGIIIGIAILIVIGFLLSLLIYFSPPMNDRRILLNQFEQLPIYSDNGNCNNKILFSMISNDFEYSPEVRCIYQSSSNAERTIELYESYLVSKGWKCFDESIYADWYRKSYFNKGVILNILFFTKGKIDMTLFEYESPATLNNNCSGASIEYPGPYLNEQGLQYTPASYWAINKSH